MKEETIKINDECPHCGKELIVLKSSIERKNRDKIDILCHSIVKTECCKKEIMINRGADEQRNYI